MPRKSRGRDVLPPSAEVNITSLVDVAFTLLVIFIIAAPVLQGGVEVAVPEADVPPITQADDPVFVDLVADGRVFLQEAPFTIEEFEESFAQLAEVGEFEHVYFRADSTVSYGRFMQVVATLSQAGVDFALVAAPETGGREDG